MQCAFPSTPTNGTQLVLDEAEGIELARQTMYRFLSLALTDPAAPRWDALLAAPFLVAATEAAQLLQQTRGQPRDADVAPGERSAAQLRIAAIVAQLHNPFFEADLEYQRTFGLLVSKKAPPYETEYCRQTLPVYRQQVMADIAGFYRAFGLEPSRELPERHDHLALELEFMAWLIALEQTALRGGYSEQAEICRDAQCSFLRDHLVWWTPAFATLLHLSCEGLHDPAAASEDPEPRTFYGAVAGALSAFVHAERVRFGLPAPTELIQPRPSDLPDEPEPRYDETRTGEGSS